MIILLKFIINLLLRKKNSIFSIINNFFHLLLYYFIKNFNFYFFNLINIFYWGLGMGLVGLIPNQR